MERATQCVHAAQISTLTYIKKSVSLSSFIILCVATVPSVMTPIQQAQPQWAQLSVASSREEVNLYAVASMIIIRLVEDVLLRLKLEMCVTGQQYILSANIIPIVTLALICARAAMLSIRTQMDLVYGEALVVIHVRPVSPVSNASQELVRQVRQMCAHKNSVLKKENKTIKDII